MAKPRNQVMEPKCFTCRQEGHFQWEWPHMECMWAKALHRPLVATANTDNFSCLVVPVVLSGKEMDVLVDMGCGRTLVCRVVGCPLAEVFQIRCIHGDIKDYPMVMVRLQVTGRRFWYAVGVGYLCAAGVGLSSPSTAPAGSYYQSRGRLCTRGGKTAGRYQA